VTTDQKVTKPARTRVSRPIKWTSKELGLLETLTSRMRSNPDPFCCTMYGGKPAIDKVLVKFQKGLRQLRVALTYGDMK